MKTELTPKEIFRKKRLISSILIAVLCFSFVPVGIYLFICFLANPNEILLLVISLFLIMFSILPAVIIINNNLKILRGDFQIYEDVLRDKTKHISTDSDGNTDEYYSLYFEDFFGQNNKRIRGSSKDFHDSSIGDKFYIIVCGKLCYVFNEKDYQISDKTKIQKFTKQEPILKESTETQSELTKSIIKKDFLFKNGHLKTVIVLFLIFLILASASLYLIRTETSAGIIFICMSVFIFFFFVTKLIYLFQILSRINKDMFNISTEKVTKIGETAFRDSNKFIRLKFEKYDKYLDLDKKDFEKIKKGDQCHLVFIEKEDTPVSVYNAKNWQK